MANHAATPDVGDDQLYRQRARYYDAIYHWKDYAGESRRVREILAAEGIDDGSRVLEAACGTGAHMAHLRQWYDISGFDASEAMISIAREKLPGQSFFVADMTSFRAPSQFDALLCLFSSIGYVRPEDQLRAAAACMARAVRSGGVIIIEPWIDPSSYTPGRAWMQTYDGPDLKLCRMVVSRREGDMSMMEFHWLAASGSAPGAAAIPATALASPTSGQPPCGQAPAGGVTAATANAGATPHSSRSAPAIEYFIDRHALWLCPHEQLAQAYRDAGFECRFESNGLMKDRGLLIGRKR